MTIPMPSLTPQQKAALLANAAEKIRGQHAAFWMGSDTDALAREVEVGSIEYLERLRRIQRGIGSIISSLTKQNIPVVFSSGEQSYTNGRRVVLSADVDPTKIDGTVGVALHEGSHIAWSNESFKFLPKMNDNFTKLIENTKLPMLASKFGTVTVKVMDPYTATEVDQTLPAVSEKKIQEHVHMVMNILEDRRIDLKQYQTAIGYRPYYDAMYGMYWHSSKIDQALQAPSFEKSVENYELHVINLTNPNWNPDALPGLKEIRKVANLTKDGLFARGDEDPKWGSWERTLHGIKGAQLSNMPLLFADAVRIVEIMYENADIVGNMAEQPQPSDEQGEGGESDLDNHDMPSQSDVRDAVARQKKFLNHEIDKSVLDGDDKRMLDTMTQSNAKVREIEGDFLPANMKAKVIIFRNITKQIVLSDPFPFRYQSGTAANSYMTTALKNGKKMGQVLASRLRVMQDEKPLTFNHQKHGRLDKRRVAALGFGVEDPFSLTILERKKPANIWLDIDFSGSMRGRPVQQAMTLAIAIAYAAEKTRTLNCTIAVRDGGNNVSRIAILYDSRRQKFSQFAEFVPFLQVAGGTPESLCFEAIKEEMMTMYKGERKYFVNISDGAPGHYVTYNEQSFYYGGTEAARHCRRMMNEFKSLGIEVLSYLIGDDNDISFFTEMYGTDARAIDVNSVTEVATTLNRLLVGKP